MAKKRVRKSWSDKEKLRICRQARVPGMSVSQVARRYDVNANMVFGWLRDERYRTADDVGPVEEQRFLPVEIVEHVRADVAEMASSQAENTGVLEVDLACGHQLRIVGAYDPEALSKLIRSLSA
ncbi:transposase [Rhizobiaceae bacterium]|nr:transposase [Rhizobiaceae bacterium]